MTLNTPKAIPILFSKDKSSLKTKTPIKIIIIRFKIVNVEIALDKNSYFNEIAQKTVPIE